MTERPAQDERPDPAVDPPIASGPAFTDWLRRRLKASGFTQRQLAEKTGVDHSTISRLIRGNRVPSLRTAAMLARGLGVPDASAPHDDLRFGSRSSPAAGVEYALRSDDSLTDAQVREVMLVYLAARVAPSRPGRAVPTESARREHVPIVGHVIGLRPR
ncbi:MAG: helix-turn-helix transcriptional regulator [Candidatus Limnocylindrales bacterium]